jgi:hypothetical protein
VPAAVGSASPAGNYELEIMKEMEFLLHLLFVLSESGFAGLID